MAWCQATRYLRSLWSTYYRPEDFHNSATAVIELYR